MDASDKTNFAETVTHFAIIFDKMPISKQLIQAYWADLKDMSRADFDNASLYLRRTSQWFPRPAAFWAARRQGWT